MTPAAENRFSLLHATPEESVADEIGEEDHVAVQLAEEAIQDYPSRPSSLVVRRPRKSDEELLADFWADVGFPSPSSWFWERRSTPDSAAPGKVSNCATVCRSSPRSSPVVARRVVRGGGSSSTASPTGLCLARPPRVGSWRGPLPRRRVSPLPILGLFIDEALVARSASASSESSSPSISSSATDPGTAATVGSAEEGVIAAASPARALPHAAPGPGSFNVEVDPVVPVRWAHLRRRRRRLPRKPYGGAHMQLTSSSSPSSRTTPSSSPPTSSVPRSSLPASSSPPAATPGVLLLSQQPSPPSSWSPGQRSYLAVARVPPMVDPRPPASASQGAAAGAVPQGGSAMGAPRPAAVRPMQPALSQPSVGTAQPQGISQQQPPGGVFGQGQQQQEAQGVLFSRRCLRSSRLHRSSFARCILPRGSPDHRRTCRKQLLRLFSRGLLSS
ncbi:hypothetical protein ACQ4PT_031903 [Festuca glaucescens]